MLFGVRGGGAVLGCGVTHWDRTRLPFGSHMGLGEREEVSGWRIREWGTDSGGEYKKSPWAVRSSPTDKCLTSSKFLTCKVIKS